MRKIAHTIFLLTMLSPAFAYENAGYEYGGKFVRFWPVINEYNASGKLFRIGGMCRSACTMFLSIKNSCIIRNATFGFHAGHKDGVINRTDINRMLVTYNYKLQRYLIDGHYMETLTFHYISGADIIDKFGYRECQGVGQTGTVIQQGPGSSGGFKN